MKELFLRLKNLSIITVVFSAVTGIVLLIRPEETVKFISILCGALLIMLGIGAWASYFAKSKIFLLQILGTLSVIAGIVICVKYQSIISAVLFLFGLFILVSAVVDLFTSIRARTVFKRGWIVSFVISLITAVLGLLIVVNPFNSMMVLVRILGIGLIGYAVADLLAYIQVKKTFTAVQNAIEDMTGEINVDAKEIDD